MYHNNTTMKLSLLLAAIVFGCALANVEAASNVNLHVSPSSSVWFIAVQPRNDNGVTTKVEIKDSASSSYTTMSFNEGWGYYSASSSNGQAYTAPLSFRLTSSSGATITAQISSIVPDAVVDTGSSYGGLSSPATAAPTSKPPTAAPTTRPPTASPTTRPPTASPTTRPPTASPTTRPPTASPTTRPATQAPTDRPTSSPATAKPTSAPTTKPTSAPTSAPATAKPTSSPTTKPTSAPTSAPSSSGSSTAAPGGRVCPAGQVWAPAPGTTWQWQLTGTIDQTIDVQMYDIDLFDATSTIISSLHSKGRAVICYFSTQYENWRPDAAAFTTSVLGSNLDDWPGERYADIRSTVVRNIMTARLDLAVSKGCDGVEPDNVDSYANSNGLGLTAADQLSFNRFIATESHKRGLSVGLKNDLDQVSALVSSFDWALNEQCNEYGECDYLTPFVTAGKAVFGVEYTGSATKVCPSMVTSRFSWLMKDLNLDASLTQCCTYATGGCATKPAFKCVNYSSKRSDIDDPIDELVPEPEQPVEIKAVEEFDSASSTLVPAFAVAVFAAVALAM